jgi:putative membrane protein
LLFSKSSKFNSSWIYFINFSILSLLLVTLVLGILNALVRPILQLLTFRLLFVSFGLVIVLINTLILYLLALLVPERFAVTSLLWALVGGLLIGILGNLLENMFGVTPPILPDEAKELRKQIEAQDVSLLEAWIQERKVARKQAQFAEGSETTPELETVPDSTKPAAEAESADPTENEPSPAAGGEA